MALVGTFKLSKSKAASYSSSANQLTKVDPYLVFSMLSLVAVSILMVFSTTAVTSSQEHGETTAFIKKHLFHIIVGLFLVMFLLNVSLEKVKKLTGPLFVLTFILLLMVLIPGLGVKAGGAQRWLSLAGFRMQPAELMKLCMVLYVATYVGRHHENLTNFKQGILIPLGIVLACIALLLAQPDFGSSVVIMFVVACQLFAGGSRLLHLLGVGAGALVGIATLIVISPYRFKRLQAFLDPFADPSGSGYQLIQSLIAVGSGGVAGTGLGGSKQKLFYLPAAHTDFIYAVIAEEFGLIGSLLVLALFLIVAWRGVIIARRLGSSPYLSTLAIGLTILLSVPAFLNMAVVTGMLPTKGMVLPLVGYGGTAMVINLAAMGLLLRLSRERKGDVPL